METTICFLNDKIIATSGSYSKKLVSVDAFRVFELSEGSIINGVITNAYSIKDALTQIKNDSTIFSKSIHIIIDSSLIYVKHAVVPNASKALMSSFVENEFIGMNAMSSEMIFDYSLIKNDSDKSKNSEVVCYAVEKSLIKSFVEIFDELKIPLESVNVSTNCLIKVTSIVPTLENKTFVIGNIDRNNITLILFVNGKYYYSTRARLLQEYESEEFFAEIATHISAINQFNKSQKTASDISEVYLCGLSPDSTSLCIQYISDLGITYCPTDVFNLIAACSNKRVDLNASDYIYNIGAFIRK